MSWEPNDPLDGDVEDHGGGRMAWDSNKHKPLDRDIEETQPITDTVLTFCAVCQGAGRVGDDECDACLGSGVNNG